MTFQYLGATIKRINTWKGLRYHVWLPGSQSDEYTECVTMQAATCHVYLKCGPGTAPLAAG